MIKKIFCFLLVFSVLLSVFAFPSFADENNNITTQDDIVVEFGYFPVEYIGGDVDISTPCFLFPRSSSYLTYQTKRLYNVGGSLYYSFDFYDGSDYVEVHRSYNPDTHFLVVQYDSVSMPYFAPESSTNFFSLYPREIKKYSIYKTNELLADHYPLAFEYDGSILSPTPNPDVWNVSSLFSTVYLDSYELRYIPSDLAVPELSSIDIYLNSPTYISFYESFSLPKYDDTSVITSASLEWCIFYSYLTPVTAPTVLPEPEPEVPDDPNSPGYLSIVTTVLVGIFSAMDSLVIYPGITLLTVLYCFIGVLLARFILKLIAGG